MVSVSRLWKPTDFYKYLKVKKTKVQFSNKFEGILVKNNCVIIKQKRKL